MRHASRAPNRRAVQVSIEFCRMSRSTKDAFPNCRQFSGRTKSFSLPKQAQVFLRKFQAQYQAFVRFAVTSSAAVSAIALIGTWLLEPFTRGGLS
jgi:hypothetical protein